MSGPAYFELSFCPSLALVSSVRRFVEELSTRLLRDQEATSKLAIATHELLENAVKYSTDGTTSLRVEIDTSDPSKQTVSVTTKNRASQDHVSRLDAYLSEMRAAIDPFAYYQQRMLRAVQASTGSQLGLARIRCEAEMHISCRYIDDCLVVVAKTGIAPPEV